MNYQGFFKRFIAFLIDSTIIAVFLIVGSFLLLGSIDTDDSLINFIVSIIVFIYFIGLPITNLQGTIGKYLVGIQIVDENGNKITLSKSTFRFLGTILSTAILYVGYVVMIFSPKKQTLHDKIAKTYVVSR